MSSRKVLRTHHLSVLKIAELTRQTDATAPVCHVLLAPGYIVGKLQGHTPIKNATKIVSLFDDIFSHLRIFQTTAKVVLKNHEAKMLGYSPIELDRIWWDCGQQHGNIGPCLNLNCRIALPLCQRGGCAQPWREDWSRIQLSPSQQQQSLGQAHTSTKQRSLWSIIP